MISKELHLNFDKMKELWWLDPRWLTDAYPTTLPIPLLNKKKVR